MSTCNEQKLYMLLLGCRPKDRLIEQHDIFFRIAPSLKSLVPALKKFWPGGQSNLHIDAWREISFVDGYKVRIGDKPAEGQESLNLFFINLGGYEKGNFDEPHYKLLIVAATMAEAVKKSKATGFFRTATSGNALSHVDNTYEVDDIINVNDLLSSEKFLHIEKANGDPCHEDEIHLGYFKLDEL